VDDKTDDVAVVPERFLRTGELVQHEALPCDVFVNHYMPNSHEPEPLKADFKNPATKGRGLRDMVQEKPRVSGVGGSSDVDVPAAYITLKKKGSDRVLGTYLVSNYLPPQRVDLDGKVYELALRPKRTYKPYVLHATEVRTEYYEGTTRPKSYSSKVVLLDPTRNEKREVMISMNDPLRYQGETFFQSQMRGVEGPGGQVM